MKEQLNFRNLYFQEQGAYEGNRNKKGSQLGAF